jgi:ornithine decarboxylase
MKRTILNKNTNYLFDPALLETLPYKTPYFLFSREKILENYHEFKHLFPNSTIHYSMKANSEPEVLKVLNEAGSGFEAASIYELDMLKKVKVSPEKIIYGTSVKPAPHIKTFLEYGVNRFAFDSYPELEKIAEVAPKGSKVYVRISVNDSGSVFKFSEKFGTDIVNVLPLILRAKGLGLTPYGISFHVGSQASDVNAWANALKNLQPIIKQLFDMDVKLEMLNLGGGYPCQYALSGTVPSLQEISESIYKQYKQLPYETKFILEPGRGIVADTGILVATVIARVERNESTWLFLDAGVYSGAFEAMAYQGSTRYPVSSMRASQDAGESLFSLAGPTGDSPDVITREALLPTDIGVGDKIILHNIGAYSLVTTSPFNGFPKPDVYYY